MRSSRPSVLVLRNTQKNFFWSLAKFAAVVCDRHPPSAPGDRLTAFCGPWHSSWWPIPFKPFILHLLLHTQRSTYQPECGPADFAMIHTPKSRENILLDMEYYICKFSQGSSYSNISPALYLHFLRLCDTLPFTSARTLVIVFVNLMILDLRNNGFSSLWLMAR